MSAVDIVTRAIDAAGQAGGSAEVQAIAANGAGAMTFSEKDMATLLEAYGSPGDAMYAIQLEAQRRVSQMSAIRSEQPRLSEALVRALRVCREAGATVKVQP